MVWKDDDDDDDSESSGAASVLGTTVRASGGRFSRVPYRSPLRSLPLFPCVLMTHSDATQATRSAMATLTSGVSPSFEAGLSGSTADLSPWDWTLVFKSYPLGFLQGPS